MTPSKELQKIIYDALVADAAFGAIAGDRVYDKRPSASDFPCVTFGDSDYFEDDYECIPGRTEFIALDCWVRDQGRRAPCKDLADAVKTALHKADLKMTFNALRQIRITTGQTFIDPDGVTAHGIVNVQATIEEN